MIYHADRTHLIISVRDFCFLSEDGLYCPTNVNSVKIRTLINQTKGCVRNNCLNTYAILFYF